MDVVLSVNLQSPVTPKPLGYGPFAEEFGQRQSISGPSFIRQQKENAAPCYPVSALGWLVMRDVCDWYDVDFTQDGEEASSPKRSISIRLLLVFVPILAFVDLCLNFLLCVFILPLLFLKCCYPFRPRLIEARKSGSPYSCCCLHEACDPLLRVLTSFLLLMCTPIVLCGICFPKRIVPRFVYWADGHTSGIIYVDRSCLCCGSQFPCGLFFRNRAVGDVMG